MAYIFLNQLYLFFSYPEISDELQEQLKTLIDKIVTEVTTTEASNIEETNKSNESTTLSISIPKLSNDMNADALEQKLKELGII